MSRSEENSKQRTYVVSARSPPAVSCTPVILPGQQIHRERKPQFERRKREVAREGRAKQGRDRTWLRTNELSDGIGGKGKLSIGVQKSQPVRTYQSTTREKQGFTSTQHPSNNTNNTKRLPALVSSPLPSRPASLLLSSPSTLKGDRRGRKWGK